ncbi:MAG: hypothetical protein CM15mP120_01350 [Pseudomonadota bacterium]|nr:MAG: hypothetical protein CM15mP120_01350 [Pseudomonadota bacterium]
MVWVDSRLPRRPNTDSGQCSQKKLLAIPHSAVMMLQTAIAAASIFPWLLRSASIAMGNPGWHKNRKGQSAQQTQLKIVEKQIFANLGPLRVRENLSINEINHIANH